MSVPLLAPLQLGSLVEAQRWMVVLNVVAVFGLFWLLVSPLLRLRLDDPRAMVVALLLCIGFPTQLTIAYGQINLIVVLLLCVGALGLADGRRPLLSGAALGVATALKLYPGFLILYLVVRGRWSALWGALLAMAALSIITMAVCSQAIWGQWVAFLSRGGFGWRPEALFSPAQNSNQSLQGVIARVFHQLGWYDLNTQFDPILGVSAALAAAAVLGVTAWWWFARSRSATHPDSPGRILRDFAAGLVALFLAAPFSWNHHLVFLIPAVGALLVFTPRAPTIAPALIAAASIVCGVEVPRWCFDWSVHAASALVLWILLLRTDGPCERR